MRSIGACLFFFQAEDGIRDADVTGVQTCALPISMAIKRAIATQQEEGIRETDLQLAFNAEYVENDIFPTTDITEDWLKLIDYDPENVVKISPVKPISDARSRATSGVI